MPRIDDYNDDVELTGTEKILLSDNGTVKNTTLNKLKNFFELSTIWGGITGSINDQTDLKNALDLKVDKVSGKGLSTNDLTNELLTLLNTKKVKNVTTDAINDRLVITYTDDSVANLNLADIINDVYVSGASLDATTNVLTLTSTNGGADVTVNLSDFVNSSEFETKANKLNPTINGDIELLENDKGIILKSINGTRHRLTVDDNGNLETEAL